MDPESRRILGNALHALAEEIESGSIDLLSVSRDNEIRFGGRRWGAKHAELTGRFTLKMELEQVIGGGANDAVQVLNHRKNGIQAVPKALGLLQPKPTEP